jgi:hypothetical protein
MKKQRNFMKRIGLKVGAILMPFMIFIVGVYFTLESNFFPTAIQNTVRSYISLSSISQAKANQPLRNAPNFTAKANPYLNIEYRYPNGLKEIYIDTVAQLEAELKIANSIGGNTIFLLNDGVYKLAKTIEIKSDHIVLSSKFGQPTNVVIQGSQHKNEGINNLFRVTGKHFVIDGITLQNAKNHLIQIAGESDADYPVIRNSILQDAYQQLFKVSYDLDKRPEISSDFGLIENNIFQYTDGIGPNFYIGGVDIHAGNSWIIRNNTFQDIASPGDRIAEHAIHVWNNAYNTIVKGNTIRDSDRGIGFGMVHKKHPAIVYSHRAGIIRDNLIIHGDNGDPFADTGIILEDSAETIIINNNIWLGHDYPRAIEYRFPSTTEVFISGNMTNKKISSRDGGQAALKNNIIDARLENILLNQN